MVSRVNLLRYYVVKTNNVYFTRYLRMDFKAQVNQYDSGLLLVINIPFGFEDIQDL